VLSDDNKIKEDVRKRYGNAIVQAAQGNTSDWLYPGREKKIEENALPRCPT